MTQLWSYEFDIYITWLWLMLLDFDEVSFSIQPWKYLMSRDEVNFTNYASKNTESNFSQKCNIIRSNIKIFLRNSLLCNRNVTYYNNNVFNFFYLWLKHNACHVTGIIYYAYERSRRKPVDEEDSKLGRWVSKPWIFRTSGNGIKTICILRDILFFFFTSTVYASRFILLYILLYMLLYIVLWQV